MKNLNKILNHKKFPIDKFFEKVLYHKDFGYYIKKNPIGKKADFITSPGISFLFSEAIAIWIISMWETMNKPKDFNIIELGPGTGQMCKKMCQTFKKFPNFNKCVKIFLYEKSRVLKSIQQKKIKEKNVKWISNFELIKKGPVIFFGNEFFDSIPVKQFEKKNREFFERYVKKDKTSNYKIFLKKINKKTKSEINKYKSIKKSTFIEFPKLGFEELNKIVNKIKNLSGGIILIDYGYLNQKNINTIQSIKLHKKNNPFKNIGKADITSLVNFKLLEEFFKNRGMRVEEIVTQSFFLKKMGILERAEIVSRNMTLKEKSDLYFRIQRLLNHNLMGELFKVIFAGKLKQKKILGFY